MLTQSESRAEWLALRKSGIGASESAAVLGISPYSTPLEVYLRKTGAIPDQPPSEAMEIGLAMEPAIATLYTAKTGKSISKTQVFLRSERFPHLLATLDAVTDDGGIVEFKNVGAFSRDGWGDDGEGIPAHYQVQVQQQMLVTGAKSCDVAALIGGSAFRTYRIERDEQLIALMVPRLADFWSRVLRLDEPDPTFRDAEMLAKLSPWSHDAIDLPYSGDRMNLSCYLAAKEEEKEASKKAALYKAHLILAMAGHSRAVFPDGSELTRKPVTRKEHVVGESTYIDFRVKLPKGTSE